LKTGIDLVRLSPEEELAYGYGGYRELTHLLGLPHIHLHGNRIDFADERSGGQASAYVQDVRTLGRATLDLGIRFDYYTLVVSAAHLSPRVNVALRAVGETVIHASYNRFFVPPPIEGVLSSSAGLTSAINEIGVALPAIEPSVEDQVELGASSPIGPLRVSATGYFRHTDNPVHTTVWPDARLYSYASFDRERAYGFEARVGAPGLARFGVSGEVNYALGRVRFYNPVTGGFITEADHIGSTGGFRAPMDQLHTLTGSLTYRPGGRGLWVGARLEHGSGTPVGHGGDHEHGEGEADHAHGASEGALDQLPSHTVGHLSFGVDLLRGVDRRARLTLRVDVENVTDSMYVVARDSQFSPAQYSIPRLLSATARVRF
jgi:hypothetical protein